MSKTYYTKNISSETKIHSDDIVKLLAKNGFRPLRETRTQHRVFRVWSKEARDFAVKYYADKRQEVEVKPQFELDLNTAEVETAPTPAEVNSGVDIDAGIPPAPDSVLSVLQRIDAKLGKMLEIWSKP